MTEVRKRQFYENDLCYFLSHVLLDELNHLLGHFLSQVNAGHLGEEGDEDIRR